MASKPLDRPATTRRRFVLETLGGLAGAALAEACGSRADVTTEPRSDGTGGTRPSGGSGGSPDGVDSGSASTGGTRAEGTGGSVGTGGAGGASTGGSSGVAGSPGTGGSSPSVCSLYPQETEGPFYLDLGLLRSDITEGKTGKPLTLTLSVVRANGCMAIKDAAVDVWHCDVSGVYDGFPGQLGGLDTTGKKSLRGTQVTDADGNVTFQTIYPGWYPGRTTHIHFKVHLSPTTVVTSQLYFPEDVTSAVYGAAPYAVHGQKDTTNDGDATAHTGGMPPVVTVTETAGGLVATLTVAVLG